MTKKILTIALAVVALALIAVPVAAADEGPTPFGADAELAYTIGSAYFGGARPEYCERIEKFEDSRESFATRISPIEPRPEVCDIYIKEGMAFPEMCRVMTQEVGMLLGESWSEDPYSAMFHSGSWSSWLAEIPGCVAEQNRRTDQYLLESLRVQCSRLSPRGKNCWTRARLTRGLVEFYEAELVEDLVVR